jgi:site-specific DNA-methyltransferase (adenine-specific)
MKFDLVVGNPPYQNGENSHFYKQFVDQAKTLSPVVAMVVPCSCFNNMESFNELSSYSYKGKNFANVDLATSWFVWEKDYQKNCKIFIDGSCVTVEKVAVTPINSALMFEFINNMQLANQQGYSISGGKLLRKDAQPDENGVCCIWSCGGSSENFDKSKISSSQKHLLSGFNKHKVVFSEAYGGFFKVGDFVYNKIGGIKYADPDHGCASGSRFIETQSKSQALNLIAYLESKFVKAVVGNVKNTFHNTAQVFSYIPVIDIDKKWSDDEIYKHFNLPKNLIDYIEKTF